jgi:hypothetical protein
MADFLIDVRTFGATGTGSSDDTAAIQSAIDASDAAGGGRVIFPAGVYQITRSLECRSSFTGLIGVGHASVIRAVGSFDTIRFVPRGDSHIYGNALADLRFDESGKTSGTTIVGRLVAQFHARRIYGASGWNAWHFADFNNVTLEHCRFEAYRGARYGYATGGGLGLTTRSDVLRLHSLVQGGARTPGMIGIEIDGFVHTVNGVGVHLVNIGAQGLLARNTLDAANDPSFFTFDDLECDYPDGESVRIDAGQRFFFNNCQLNGSRGRANIFIGVNVRGVAFTGGFSAGAQQAGIAIAGQDVSMSGMHFYFNSSPEFGGSKNAYPGILLGSTSRDVIVNGCRSGQEASSDYQSAGCQVDTGADGFVIVGNDFRHNVMRKVNNGTGGEGPSKIIANNLY